MHDAPGIWVFGYLDDEFPGSVGGALDFPVALESLFAFAADRGPALSRAGGLITSSLGVLALRLCGDQGPAQPASP